VGARRITVVFAAVCALVAACGGVSSGGEQRADVPRNEPTAGQAQRAADGTTVLGARLLETLTAQPGNVALSPSLLAAQIGTIRAGARSATGVELDTLFTVTGQGQTDTGQPTAADVPGAAPVVADLGGAVALLDELSGPQRSSTRSGRILVDHDLAIWFQRGMELDDAYLEATGRAFGIGARPVDFRSSPESARELINRWAVNASGGRVTQLLSRGQVSASTRLLSTGMLGLTAPWQYPFTAAATRESTFQTDSGREVRVDMMRLSAPVGVGLAVGTDWEAVTLPYLGGELAMVVIIPAPGALDAVQARLGDGLLDEVRRSMRPQPVTVRLPRVAFTSALVLADELVALGTRTLFDIDAADLTGMAPAERVALTDVIQQVYLAVDEGGTGAGAATFTSPAAVVPANSPVIIADRPFLVAVVDRLTGMPLLIGRIGDPSG
jgi:serine protease inhibitor